VFSLTCLEKQKPNKRKRQANNYIYLFIMDYNDANEESKLKERHLIEPLEKSPLD